VSIENFWLNNDYSDLRKAFYFTKGYLNWFSFNEILKLMSIVGPTGHYNHFSISKICVWRYKVFYFYPWINFEVLPLKKTWASLDHGLNWSKPDFCVSIFKEMVYKSRLWTSLDYGPRPLWTMFSSKDKLYGSAWNFQILFKYKDFSIHQPC
jgi:hypothetical protein